MKKILLLVVTIAISVGAVAQEFTPTYYESSDSDLQGRFKVAMDIPLSQKVKLTWGEQRSLHPVEVSGGGYRVRLCERVAGQARR